MVSAGPDGVVMVEGEAAEVAEADCAAAIQKAEEWLGTIQKELDGLRAAVGVADVPDPAVPELPEVPASVREPLAKALEETGKHARHEACDAVRAAWLADIPEDRLDAHKAAFQKAKTHLTRERVLTGKARLDGRGPEDIRPIWCLAGFLPRAHGSAVFTRGETQSIVSCTLASTDEAQRVDGLGGLTDERFLLHYNFPPYSVGEIRPLRGPGRREIGHGTLARRGLQAVFPPVEDWPYTVRVESEITESNGSSSMATVCGGTLAMLDAGVPLKRPTAGIAMGLISDGQRTAVLSDILGDEDHLGDMDFKVIGTSEGVTALQLDNKIGGLTTETLTQALEQAKAGRLHILAAMAETLATPRKEGSPHAPRVHKTAILPQAIGALIGPRGANIQGITKRTGANVTVEDDGQVLVYATTRHAADEALAAVQRSAGIVHKGKCYRGTVTGVRDFGVFVKINELNEGLVPVEELDKDRVDPMKLAKEGDEMVVSVLGADPRGRLRLSRKAALGAGDAQIVF